MTVRTKPRSSIFIAIMISGFAFPAWSQQLETIRADHEPLLTQYEKSGREFVKLEIGDRISYFHQRMIGDALVEFDYVRYIFDAETGELIEKAVNWREDLPETIDPLVSKQEAEALISGEIRSSKLYVISPESHVHPLDPVPDNPCWVVRSDVDGRQVITIIDAMTGELLGKGVPPPAPEGYSLTGPWEGFECIGSWEDWAASANAWFSFMGYETKMEVYPSTSTIQDRLQNDDLAVFYELAHGGSHLFQNGCPAYTMSSSVRAWLHDYANVPFAFIGSCGGLCEFESNTFSYEFRKGRNFDAAVVGYCGMDTERCDDAWMMSVPWQRELFYGLSTGLSMQNAFNEAMIEYPMCLGCMLFHGDRNLKLVPVVTRSLCDTLYDATENPLTLNSRDYYIRCDVIVPEGEALTVDPSVRLAFMFGSAVIADGALLADGSAGTVQLLSDTERNRGIEITGLLRISNGGTIRIYDE